MCQDYIYEDYEEEEILFEAGQPFNPLDLEKYLYYIDEKNNLFYLKTDKDFGVLRLETINTIPIFAKGVYTLMSWYPNNKLNPAEAKLSEATMKIKISTMYDFLLKARLIEDNIIDRMNLLIGPDNFKYIKQLITSQIMQDKNLRLTSFTMNQQKYNSKYWENKYNILVGLQNGGVWDIVDFRYNDQYEFCELGHPIKRIVVVRERSTGLEMQYGEYCIEDFLIIKQNQMQILKQYFKKYKDMLIEYWLLTEVFNNPNDNIYQLLQYTQVDLIYYLDKANYLVKSSKYNINQHIRTGKRVELPEALTDVTLGVIYELQKRNMLVPRYYFDYLIFNDNIVNALDLYKKRKPIKTEVDNIVVKAAKILSYGVYGFNIDDVVIKKYNYFTDYIGNPISKKDVEFMIKQLNYTKTELNNREYVGEEIVNAAGITFSTLLNKLATVSINQINISDNNIKVEVENNEVVLEYKGYQTKITHMYKGFLKEINNKQKQTLIEKLLEVNHLVLDGEKTIKEEVLNYDEKDNYIGVYDFLKELPNIHNIDEVIFFNKYMRQVNELLSIQGYKHQNGRINLIYSKIKYFILFWNKYNKTEEPEGSSKENYLEISAYMSDFVKNKLVFNCGLTEEDNIILNNEILYQEQLYDVTNRRKVKEEVVNTKQLDREALTEVIKQLPPRKELTKEQKEVFKNNLSTLSTNKPKDRFLYVQLGHNLISQGYVATDTAKKLNFICNNVYKTAKTKQVVTEKQWKYGGDLLMILIDNFIKTI